MVQSYNTIAQMDILDNNLAVKISISRYHANHQQTKF
jgi:hypothetical protein